MIDIKDATSKWSIHTDEINTIPCIKCYLYSMKKVWIYLSITIQENTNEFVQSVARIHWNITVGKKKQQYDTAQLSTNYIKIIMFVYIYNFTGDFEEQQYPTSWYI